MGVASRVTLVVLALIGCKRAPEPEAQAQGSAAASGSAAQGSAAAVGSSAAAAERGPRWYRAIVRADDGIEARFFLGVPAPGAPGEAVFRVGGHEVRAAATFDGKRLEIPMAVHQTAIEASAGAGGDLAGTFSASWRAWGASSLSFAAVPVDAPALRELGTVPGEGAPVELKEPRTVWRVAMKDSGAAKLVIEQAAPGELTGVLFLDTGNIVYLAGNGRGDAVVLTGFDGTAGYRLELALAADRAKASGTFSAGHRFDWREALTAARGADFALAVKPRPARRGVKIELPAHRTLAALPPGPLVVELAGSWCSTCRYAAPFLVELDRAYRPRGLQLVTLLYEFTDDPEADAKQAAAFQRTYGVTWPVVPIAGDVDDFAQIMPRGLTDLNPAGFPVLLFLAPDRSLVGLHAGFPAPAAADERRRVEAELRAHVEAILARAR